MFSFPLNSISIHFLSFPFISTHFHSFPFIFLSFPFISFQALSFPFISIKLITFISFHFPFISFHFHFISFHFPFMSFHFHSFPFISFQVLSFPFMSIKFHSFRFKSWSSKAEKTIFMGIVRVSFGYRFFQTTCSENPDGTIVMMITRPAMLCKTSIGLRLLYL